MDDTALGPTELTPFVDALALPAVRHPSPAPGSGCAHLRIVMRRAAARLHASLPATELWTYDGSYPGPAIEVRRGQRVVVEWINELAGPLPFASVIAPDAADGEPPPQNQPGSQGAPPDPDAVPVRPWTVAHLHGGKTQPDSDGWTENMLLPGQSKLSTYHNDQRGTLLWYHDHAMEITRFNVFAGLAGLWVVRDAEDDRLPQALREHEIPLVIQDRNLETDGHGHLTGALLHKVEDGTREFFGPYTLVNGRIWPHLHVRARPYRFRVLNGSNSRIYRLFLLDEHGAPANDAITQIGTDGGLLGAPIPFAPDGGLLLAPAERADLVVDFSRLRGRTLTWVNCAGAPFHGAASLLAPGVPDPDNRVPFPNVIQFRVSPHAPGAHAPLPAPLSPSFVRLSHLVPHTEHRLVALVEDGDRHMLTLRELVPLAADPAPTGAVVWIQQGADAAKPYRVGARNFEDTVNFFVAAGATEVWKFINLTEDTHPMHIHLVQFQAIGRNKVIDPDAFDLATDSTATPLRIDAAEIGIDPNMQGWKDTIRVDPSEMLSVMATFEGFVGRYMYHCHIVEHEDRDMMRPFVVLPAPIAADMGAMAGGSMPPM